MNKLTKNRVKQIIELHEFYASGYKNLSGCWVEVSKVHKEEGFWIADVKFIEQEDDCTSIDSCGYCEYPEKVIRQLERQFVQAKILKERK